MIDLLDRHLIFALLKTPQKRRRNIVIISCTNINKDVCIYIYIIYLEDYLGYALVKHCIMST